MVAFQLASSSSTKTLLYLLAATSLQIALISCQDMPAESLIPPVDNIPCLHECPPGYECRYGICKPQDCTQLEDCSSEPVELVCASNGVTYNNLCEVERARCELRQDIKYLYDGTCITAAPPPAQDCKAHQARFELGKHPEETCRQLLELYVNSTLDQMQIDGCYRPHCSPYSDQYLVKQCLFDFEGWCWCSTTDGEYIQGTLQENMPPNYCSNRHKCLVDGRTHEDGVVFTPTSVCGLCECLNGTHSCFVEFDVDSSGRLSNESLETLTTDLIQVFNFQYNNKDHERLDIKFIYMHPTSVTEEQKKQLLEWKFSYYNIDEDKYLNNFEEDKFLSQLLSLFGPCNKYIYHIKELLDENGDDKITLEEWKQLFQTQDGDEESGDSSQELVKREAVDFIARKPLHLRKKFYYVLQ